MKNTSFALRIFKLFLAVILLLSLQSCSHQEEEGSVCLNIPSSVCQRLAARTPTEDMNTMTVFVTGDWEAKKTVSFSPENLVHGGVTIEFDGIRGGANVRVVCLIGNDNADNCMIGISDEVKIIGGQENAASVKIANVQLGISSDQKKLYLQDPSYEDGRRKDLPSCTYSWYYKDPSDTEFAKTTTESECIFTNDEGSYATISAGIRTCTIYCNDTRIITLKSEQY